MEFSLTPCRWQNLSGQVAQARQTPPQGPWREINIYYVRKRPRFHELAKGCRLLALEEDLALILRHDLDVEHIGLLLAGFVGHLSLALPRQGDRKTARQKRRTYCRNYSNSDTIII